MMTQMKLIMLTVFALLNAIQARVHIYDKDHIQIGRERERVLKKKRSRTHKNQTQKDQTPQPTFLPLFSPTVSPSTNPSNTPSEAPSTVFPTIFESQASKPNNDGSISSSEGLSQESSSESNSETPDSLITPAINVMEMASFTATVSSDNVETEVTESLEESLLNGMRDNMPNLISIDLFVDQVEEIRRHLEERMITIHYSGDALFEGLPLPSDVTLIETQTEVLNDTKVIEKAGITQLKIWNTIETPVDDSTNSPNSFPEQSGFLDAVPSNLNDGNKASGVLITFVVIGSLLFVALGAFLGYRYWKLNAYERHSHEIPHIQKSDTTNEITNPDPDSYPDEEKPQEDEASQKIPNIECDDFSMDFSFDGESVLSSSANSTAREAATRDATAAYLRERALLQSQRQQLLYRNNDDSDVEFSYDRVGEIRSSDVSICPTETSNLSATDCIEVAEDGETSYLSNFTNIDNILDVSASLDYKENETPFDEMPFDEHIVKGKSAGTVEKVEKSDDLQSTKAPSLISNEVLHVEKTFEESQNVEQIFEPSPIKSSKPLGRRSSRKQARGEQEEDGLSSFLRERRKAKIAARMSEP